MQLSLLYKLKTFSPLLSCAAQTRGTRGLRSRCPADAGEWLRLPWCQKVNGTNEKSQRRLGLLQHIIPELENIIRACALDPAHIHGLGAHAHCRYHIINKPQDSDIHEHDNNVRARRFNAFELVGLDLGRDEALKLPIAVRQEIEGTAVQNDLLAIVLRYGHITLVDRQERRRTEWNDGICQVDKVDKLQHGRTSVVQTGRQLDWLTKFRAVTNKTLGDSNFFVALVLITVNDD
jgi:hypothetical protein